MKQEKPKVSKVYKIVTERIINQLESGVIPWKRPWKSVTGGEDFLPVSPNGDFRPRNLFSNKPYRGYNLLATMAAGFTSPYWVTKKKVLEHGGRIKAEEFKQGTMVVYWKQRFAFRKVEEKDPDTGEIVTVKKRIEWMTPFYHWVWNVQQTTGLEELIPKTKKREKIAAEKATVKAKTKQSKKDKMRDCISDTFIDKYLKELEGPNFSERRQNRACYNPPADSVMVPEIDQFKTPDHFYAAAFHELIHSTGHKQRLEREGVAGRHYYGDKAYSEEELIAELGACFACSINGIENEHQQNNAAAYIEGWRTKLSKEPELIIKAAQAAQKAVDHMMGVSFK